MIVFYWNLQYPSDLFLFTLIVPMFFPQISFHGAEVR